MASTSIAPAAPTSALSATANPAVRYVGVSTDGGRVARLGRAANKVRNPAVIVKDTLTDELVVVVSILRAKIATAFIVDFGDYEKVKTNFWYYGVNGYALNNTGTMHKYLFEPEEGMTVDHINRFPMDNRRVNIRIVKMDAQNANRTESNGAVPIEILNQAGMAVTPKYMYFDTIMDRIDFHGHPYAQALASKGITVRTSGTRSTACSMVEKVMDALRAYVEMVDAYAKEFPEEYAKDEDMAVLRITNAENALLIVKAANAFDPDIIPLPEAIDFDALMSEHGKATKMLGNLMHVNQRTIVEVAELGGPRNLVSNEIEIPTLGAIALLKGDYVILFSVGIRKIMASLNPDADDLRVMVTDALLKLLPGAKLGRMKLIDIIWICILGREVPEGMTVQTINMNRWDLRTENLTLIVDNGRGQKPPASVAFDKELVGDLGMAYMPKGLTVSKDARMGSLFVITIKTEAKKVIKKLSFKTPEAASKVFNETVLPFMRANLEDFDANNEVYQRRCREYDEAMAIVAAAKSA